MNLGGVKDLLKDLGGNDLSGKRLSYACVFDLNDDRVRLVSLTNYNSTPIKLDRRAWRWKNGDWKPDRGERLSSNDAVEMLDAVLDVLRDYFQEDALRKKDKP